MKKNVKIRPETVEDYREVFEVIEKAFLEMEKSDHREQFLVERLRKSESFIPELSLVAELEGKIIGHILLTKIKIVDEKEEFDSLALAPLAVLPEFQRKGVGKELIETAHRQAKDLGYQSIVVVGHSDYYPKFGYEMIKKHGITLPFEADEKSCLVIELSENGLKNVSGKVEYSKEFFQ